ncbi:hypothetical protein [Chryseobacterium sp. NKUCC03_KSP]|uniref:hypothetical protein n=1 Tax=Chryseobacterium sp. NKUCC03_KSP TaxID=2842125 RepID=UPI001C5A998D|nr:hypothetical protein [Chryseobacterium sp. NKUCC03_KSP]MBW3520905.1 hypothetical protein [Chryseobacterium sp. NKUCC03_KSP]
MKKKIPMFLLLLFMIIIGCKKERNVVRTLKDEKINLQDTISTGNKLPMPSSAKDKLDKNVGDLFIKQAQKGILNELKKENKNYLDSYFFNKNTLSSLIKNKPFKSLGIKLTLVEIHSNKYGHLLNIPSSKDSLLYFMVSYVKEDGYLDTDNHHLVFNLKNNFDINNRIKDGEFLDAMILFDKDINKIITKYSSGNQNTSSIYFGWGDIFDMIEKNHCNVNFQIGEIINYNDIEKILNSDPVLAKEKIKYERSYKGKEKRLTIIGDYIECLPIKDSFSSYFDMGSLYP